MPVEFHIGEGGCTSRVAGEALGIGEKVHIRVILLILNPMEA